MAYPASPQDGSNFRIGMIVHKAGATLTAVIIRCILKTTGSDPVGWTAMATHVEDDAAAYTDAGGLTPLALIGAKRGAHVAVGTAGDVGALQADSKGALMVQPAGATSFNVPAALTVGTSETDYTVTAGAQQVRIYNNHATAVIYYKHVTGVTTANGYPIPPGGQDELRIVGGAHIFIISDTASTNVRIREEIAA